MKSIIVAMYKSLVKNLDRKTAIQYLLQYGYNLGEILDSIKSLHNK